MKSIFYPLYLPSLTPWITPFAPDITDPLKVCRLAKGMSEVGSLSSEEPDLSNLEKGFQERDLEFVRG